MDIKSIIDDGKSKNPVSFSVDHHSIVDTSNTETNETPLKRKRGRPSNPKDKICQVCRTSDTPEWRCGKFIDQIGVEFKFPLCNACGLRYSKKLKSGNVNGYEALKQLQESFLASFSRSSLSSPSSLPIPLFPTPTFSSPSQTQSSVPTKVKTRVRVKPEPVSDDDYDDSESDDESQSDYQSDYQSEFEEEEFQIDYEGDCKLELDSDSEADCKLELASDSEELASDFEELASGSEYETESDSDSDYEPGKRSSRYKSKRSERVPGRKRGRPCKPKPAKCIYFINGKLCGATKSPEWRKYEDKKKKIDTLICNRCGLHFKKAKKAEIESKKTNSINKVIN